MGTTYKDDESKDDSDYRAALVHASREEYEEYICIIKRLASKGHCDAQMTMGVIFSQGVGSIETDFSEALKWHKKAEHGEDPENYQWIAVMYDPNFYQGQDIPFKDKKVADEYYEKAIKGYEKKATTGDAEAMLRLSELARNAEEYNYWLNAWKKIQDEKE